jgi:hypothetical protein
LANETDFLDLYRTLGLSPGCGLPEFKQAYRRHVALLHPDRLVGDHRRPPDTEPLRQLIAQYGAAMEFQRRHGRLPGAAAPARAAMSEVTARIPCPSPALAGDSRHSHSRLLVLLATLAVGVLLWDTIPPAPTPEAAPASTATTGDDAGGSGSAVARMPPPSLSIGMSPESVRAIEGDPVDIRDNRWEYGPSWISFEHDKVADWYSSPLHSLRTADSHPLNTRR